MDISLNYLKNTRDDITVCCADLEDLPYDDNFFDLIICSDVHEHALHLDQVIQEISRVLKRKGVLILRVPLNKNLKPYLSNIDYNLVHLRSFCKEDLISMFTKIWKYTNLEIKEIGKTFSLCAYRDWETDRKSVV